MMPFSPGLRLESQLQTMTQIVLVLQKVARRCSKVVMVLRQEVQQHACLVLKASADALLLIPLTDSFHFHRMRERLLCWLVVTPTGCCLFRLHGARTSGLCSAPQVFFRSDFFKDSRAFRGQKASLGGSTDFPPALGGQTGAARGGFGALLEGSWG